MFADQQKRGRDSGFTLIEIFVVVIIIGILAGIAIPIFLNQTRKADNAKARSDLRNLATAEEGYATDSSAYATAAELAAAGGSMPVSAEDTVYVYTAGVAGYCLVGHATNADQFLVYDSQSGGMQTPAATLGAAQAMCTGSGYTPGGSFVRDSSGLHVS
jgi:prepilin-type N-terminal cleavage/methylation domain-containing protein